MLDEDVRAHASDHHDDDSRRAIGRGTRPEEQQRRPDLEHADQEPEPDGIAPEGKCPRPPAQRVELVPTGPYEHHDQHRREDPQQDLQDYPQPSVFRAHAPKSHDPGVDDQAGVRGPVPTFLLLLTSNMSRRGAPVDVQLDSRKTGAGIECRGERGDGGGRRVTGSTRSNGANEDARRLSRCRLLALGSTRGLGITSTP